MKSLVTTLLLCSIITLQSYGQEDYETYRMSYLTTPDDFKISVTGGAKQKVIFYIGAIDIKTAEINKIGIRLEDMLENERFRDYVNECKAKYIEWKDVAIKNNVTKLSKEMEIKSPKMGAYWYHYNGWEFDDNVRLRAVFKIVESDSRIQYLLLFYTQELQSISNEYITSDGPTIVFNSSEEIEDFVEKLDFVKAREFLEAPKVEDLFKN